MNKRFIVLWDHVGYPTREAAQSLIDKYPEQAHGILEVEIPPSPTKACHELAYPLAGDVGNLF